jgi:glutaredoxin
VAGHDLTSYVSQDGKTFFPEAIDMDSAENSAGNQNNQPQESKQSAEKADVPEVELFVMSYCPYGLQAEKGMLPVVELLGSKIKFSLKFVDYAMHGEKEIDENLRQYCIEKQGVSKLASYLKCFTDKGDSAACVPVTKIDVGALNTCLAATDAEFKIKEKFEDQNAWIGGRYPPFDVDKDDNVKYGVRGSPTLVVNGAKVSAARDPQSILTAICSGFSNLPDECGQKLSGNAPSPGFGSGTGSNANASCGN